MGPDLPQLAATPVPDSPPLTSLSSLGQQAAAVGQAADAAARSADAGGTPSTPARSSSPFYTPDSTPRNHASAGSPRPLSPDVFIASTAPSSIHSHPLPSHASPIGSAPPRPPRPWRPGQPPLTLHPHPPGTANSPLQAPDATTDDESDSPPPLPISLSAKSVESVEPRHLHAHAASAEDDVATVVERSASLMVSPFDDDSGPPVSGNDGAAFWPGHAVAAPPPALLPPPPATPPHAPPQPPAQPRWPRPPSVSAMSEGEQNFQSVMSPASTQETATPDSSPDSQPTPRGQPHDARARQNDAAAPAVQRHVSFKDAATRDALSDRPSICTISAQFNFLSSANSEERTDRRATAATGANINAAQAAPPALQSAFSSINLTPPIQGTGGPATAAPSSAGLSCTAAPAVHLTPSSNAFAPPAPLPAGFPRLPGLSPRGSLDSALRTIPEAHPSHPRHSPGASLSGKPSTDRITEAASSAAHQQSELSSPASSAHLGRSAEHLQAEDSNSALLRRTMSLGDASVDPAHDSTAARLAAFGVKVCGNFRCMRVHNCATDLLVVSSSQPALATPFPVCLSELEIVSSGFT